MTKLLANFKNNKQDGKSYVYYPDGMIKFEISYDENKVDGIAKFYDAKGKLKLKTSFQDGKFKKNILVDEDLKKLVVPKNKKV